MRARLFSPSRNAMTSGQARSKGWVLEFEPTSSAEIDPLMGWTSSTDTQRQVRLRFDTREAAQCYAKEQGITLVETRPTRRKPNIRPQGYAENFAYARRRPWTH